MSLPVDLLILNEFWAFSLYIYWHTFIVRSSHLEVFCKTDVLKYFPELTVNYLAWSPF